MLKGKNFKSDLKRRSGIAVRRTVRLTGPMLALLVFWVGLNSFGLLPEWLYTSVCLGMSVIFFILAIPIGVLLRLDELTTRTGLDTPGKAACLCLVICAVNLFLMKLLSLFILGDPQPKVKKRRSEVVVRKE